METSIAPAGRPQRVLVVDDEATVREVVVPYLEREGYRAVEAADGSEALDKIAASPPDLIILDVMLPKVDGFSILSHCEGGADAHYPGKDLQIQCH